MGDGFGGEVFDGQGEGEEACRVCVDGGKAGSVEGERDIRLQC
jgi:hypothetical protein